MIDEKLNVLVFGAGAIGTYIGGNLSLNGHQVVFIERPEVAEKLLISGLRIHQNGVENIIPNPHIVTSLSDILKSTSFNLAIFALKSYDTNSALESISAYKSIFPPILCLSNGISNETAIGNVIGNDMVIPGSVTSAISHRAPGSILVERIRGMGITCGHIIVKPLVEALNQANLNARLYSDSIAMKWSKLFTNLLANASSAILDMTPGEIYSHPELYRVEMTQLCEALKVMTSMGTKMVNLPGTPVKLLAFAVQRLPTNLSRLFLWRAIGKARAKKMPSFHIDLYNKKGKSEVDYLNGAVVREGKSLNIPTPVNAFLTETLIQLTQGKLPLKEYAQQPEKFLSHVNKKNKAI